MSTMSVRIPDELHARVAAAAEADHISMNTAIVQAAENWVALRAQQALVRKAMNEVFEQDAALFDRLSDA